MEEPPPLLESISASSEPLSSGIKLSRGGAAGVNKCKSRDVDDYGNKSQEEEEGKDEQEPDVVTSALTCSSLCPSDRDACTCARASLFEVTAARVLLESKSKKQPYLNAERALIIKEQSAAFRASSVAGIRLQYARHNLAESEAKVAQLKEVHAQALITFYEAASERDRSTAASDTYDKDAKELKIMHKKQTKASELAHTIDVPESMTTSELLQAYKGLQAKSTAKALSERNKVKFRTKQVAKRQRDAKTNWSG